MNHRQITLAATLAPLMATVAWAVLPPGASDDLKKDASERLRIQILQARRREKDFFLRRDDKCVKQHEEGMQA